MQVLHPCHCLGHYLLVKRRCAHLACPQTASGRLQIVRIWKLARLASSSAQQDMLVQMQPSPAVVTVLPAQHPLKHSVNPWHAIWPHLTAASVTFAPTFPSDIAAPLFATRATPPPMAYKPWPVLAPSLEDLQLAVQTMRALHSEEPCLYVWAKCASSTFQLDLSFPTTAMGSELVNHAQHPVWMVGMANQRLSLAGLMGVCKGASRCARCKPLREPPRLRELRPQPKHIQTSSWESMWLAH